MLTVPVVVFVVTRPFALTVAMFSLLDDHETEEELTDLANRLKINYPETQFYTSHCTGDKVFAILKAVMGEKLQSFCCGTINRK